MIPISQVILGADEEALVLEVLRSGMLAQGPKVAELERMFADLTSTSHAIAVTSGTTALVLAIEALRLEPGDEVITSPFTFAATLNAILEAGATARFADIDPATFGVTAATLEPSTGPRTRALMPVHLYGLAGGIEAISTLGAAHEWTVIEDAAQAHGAAVDGRPVGSFGIGCFSLYGTKNVTTGEGGMITLDDDELADRMRVLRNQGMRQRYQYEVPGHNYRMTDLQAAVGIPQMARLETINAARRSNAARLVEGLDGIEGFIVPSTPTGHDHVWHQFTVRVTAAARRSRDELVEALTERGIGCGIYYPKLVHDYDCYRAHPRVRIDETPVAAEVVDQVLSLPVHPGLSSTDVDQVIETVRSLLT